MGVQCRLAKQLSRMLIKVSPKKKKKNYNLFQPSSTYYGCPSPLPAQKKEKKKLKENKGNKMVKYF
jgi:hypothetical protein